MIKYNQFTGLEREKLKDELKTAQSMGEFLKILEKNFDLDNCKVGHITKAMLADNMVRIVLPMINPLEK